MFLLFTVYSFGHAATLRRSAGSSSSSTVLSVWNRHTVDTAVVLVKAVAAAEAVGAAPGFVAGFTE